MRNHTALFHNQKTVSISPLTSRRAGRTVTQLIACTFFTLINSTVNHVGEMKKSLPENLTENLTHRVWMLVWKPPEPAARPSAMPVCRTSSLGYRLQVHECVSECLQRVLKMREEAQPAGVRCWLQREHPLSKKTTSAPPTGHRPESCVVCCKSVCFTAGYFTIIQKSPLRCLGL